MDKLKWYKNPEMIVALSALLIGLVTAFTSIYSAYVDRAYSRAAVWPKLEIFRNFSQNTFSYSVTNNGTGPALINYAKIKYGSKYNERWSDVKIFKGIRQSHISNRTLSPQSTITPLSYKGEDAKVFLTTAESISIELCYCSIYDECWVVDTRNYPVLIESCIVNEEQAFMQ